MQGTPRGNDSRRIGAKYGSANRLTLDDRRLLRYARTTAWAVSYSRAYRGDIRFMKEMRAKAMYDPSWVPTAKQTEAIIRIAEGGRDRR